MSIRPDPKYLAMLASNLARNDPSESPESAIKRAMQLHVEAVFACSTMPADFEEFVKLYGSKKRNQALKVMQYNAAMLEMVSETLRLDPSADDDPVRQFLKGRGLKLKTARAVVDNLERLHREAAALDENDIKSDFKDCLERYRRADGSYELPRVILGCVVNEVKARRRNQKLKGHQTRRES